MAQVKITRGRTRVLNASAGSALMKSWGEKHEREHKGKDPRLFHEHVNILKKPSTDQHDINELLFASEDVSLFLHAVADGFRYESDALDQTELHGQVLKRDKNNTNRCAMIQKKTTQI